ncbi:MAG: FAD-dependent oxidoreductase [Oscillospiraceae bacterium]
MKLFEKTTYGNIQLKNHVAVAPMGMKTDIDGFVSPRNIAFYERIAEGGAGLIMVGCAMCTQKYEGRPTWAIENLFQIAGFGQLIDNCHAYGAKVIIQLTVGLGRVAYADRLESAPYGPSETPLRGNPAVNTRPFTKEQIAEVVKAYGQAALRLKKAGVDGIEMHAYGGYLFDQFLTSAWNRRTDEYGGPLRNRMRFLLECFHEAKRTCGDGFPISAKVTVDHRINKPGYRTIEEGVELCKILEEEGVDALHIDTGCYERYYCQIPSVYEPQGMELDVIEKIRENVKISLMGQGKLNRPELAEAVVAKGSLDVIAMGHQMLADPDWPIKVKENRLREINYCIGCNECMMISIEGKHRSCAVNPFSGHEVDFTVAPALKTKKLLVVGGGPAGMAAALTAASRGIEVALWERSGHLGGNLAAAGAPVFKQDVRDYLGNLVYRLEHSGVRIELNKTATKEEILAAGVDDVVLATGSDPIRIPLKKAENSKVEIITGNEALLRKNPPQGNVVVVGGGLVGCEVALQMEQTPGVQAVTMVEALDSVLKTVKHFGSNDHSLKDLLAQSKINIVCSGRVSAVTEAGLVYEKDGQTQEIPCDVVIIAVGYRANNALENEIWNEVGNVRLVGDAVAPRKVLEAVHEAFHAVRVLK